MVTNERQNTGSNKKELEVEWWDRKGWATLGGMSSLEELPGTHQGEECPRQREQQGKNHQNLGQKEINWWRK